MYALPTANESRCVTDLLTVESPPPPPHTHTLHHTMLTMTFVIDLLRNAKNKSVQTMDSSSPQ